VQYDPAVDGMKGKATAPRLYNLAKDIGESKDLMDREPEKAKELQAAWNDWNEQNKAPLWGDGINIEAGQKSIRNHRKAAGTGVNSTSVAGQ
jgi:hypothetical protein